MEDESTPNDDPNAEIPPTPPTGESTPPRRLHRSYYDRMAAGVSGGIAEYFGIDPIIVRLGFVAATLLGGSGVALYLIAWLVMPDAHEDESAAFNVLRGGHRAGGRSLLALGLLVVGIFVLTGSVFWFPSGDGLFLPLLILAAGVALLVWPADGSGWGNDHSAGSEERDASREEWRRERDAVRGEWRRERRAWQDNRHEWRHGYRRGFPFSDDADGPPPPPRAGQPRWTPPPPPRRHRRRRPRPFLGPIAVAAMLLYTGLTVFATQVGWWATDPAAFLAVCLMIIGATLVVSAFLGRARGLIWLGLLLLPAAWALSVIDLTWWEGVGEESVVVDELAELKDEYRWGIGEFHIDLSDLDLEGETVELAVGLTIGELKIWIPETIGVEIDLDGSAGSVIVNDRGLELNDDGVNVSMDRIAGDPTGGTLLLDADIGFGEAEIIICGAGGEPCP
jgi:phage shock protein PspC (stress-responsive transcriptional regulator)